MVFRDRRAAGERLAEALASVVRPPCVVAAIPRGGVSVAQPIVERLGLPLAVVYARKLTAPIAPEFAFGALDEDGQSTVDARSVALLGLTSAEVEQAKARALKEISRRVEAYGVAPLGARLAGAAVVLVDDGLATGLTMRAALEYARRHGAREVVVAVPCAAEAAADEFRRLADRFVCPVVDADFAAVGEYYVDFEPVADEEVLAILARAGHSPAPTGDHGSLRLTFKNARGLALAGRLMQPPNPGPHPVAVFAHSRGGSKDSSGDAAVAEALCARGLSAFLFDVTGHRACEGTEADGTLAQRVDDLNAALDAVLGLDEIAGSRVAVVGARAAAAAAVLAAARDSRIRALALRSPELTGAEEAVPRVTVPTLLVVGEHDAPVREACESLCGRFGGPWRLEVIAAGDHLFEAPAALARAARVTAAWLSRHLLGA